MEENSGFLFALWQKFVRGGVTSSFLYPCWKLQCRRWWMSLSHWGVFMSAHGRLLNRYCFLGTLDSHSWALSAGSDAFEVSNIRLGVLGRVWIPLFLWLLNRLLCHDGFSAPQLALPQFSPPSHLVLDPHDSCGCQGKIPEARRESWPEPPAADTVWGWFISQIKLINSVSGSGSGCSAVLLWVFSPGAYAMGMWLCLCTPQASAGVVLVLLEVLFNESWPKCHLRLKHSQVTLLSLED